MMLDFYADPIYLNDTELWKTILLSIVEIVGMRPLSPAFIYPSECENEYWDPPRASGLSGFIVLAESHIAFHTFVEAQFVFLDLFSCNPFTTTTVTDFLQERIGARDFNAQTIQRGYNFPLR